MKINIDGIEPQFKVYKMTESVENKFYIGKTKNPLKDRMSGHRHGDHGEKSADRHFSDVGWNNVTVEIIDTANDDEELKVKEAEQIFKNRSPLMLNKYLNNAKVKAPVTEFETTEKITRLWSEELQSWIIRTIQIQIHKKKES